MYYNRLVPIYRNVYPHISDMIHSYCAWPVTGRRFRSFPANVSWIMCVSVSVRLTVNLYTYTKPSYYLAVNSYLIIKVIMTLDSLTENYYPRYPRYTHKSQVLFIVFEISCERSELLNVYFVINNDEFNKCLRYCLRL